MVGCRLAPWCATAIWRTTRDGAAGIPGAVAGAALRGIAATPQYGNDWRESPAGAALLLLSRYRLPLQQARILGRAVRQLDGYHRIHAILGTSEH